MDTIAATTQEAIAQWIGGDELTKKILSACDFSGIRDGAIFINCPEDLLNEIREISGTVCVSPLALIGVQKIYLVSNGIIRNQFNTITAMDYLVGMPLPPIIQSIPNSNQAIAIVRMGDHKGLFCTNGIERFSQAKPNDWTGEDMSKYHIPAELNRLVERLEKHRYLSQFEYNCIDFTGAKRRQTVNAWLTVYNNDLCRVIEVLSSDLV